MRKIAVLAVSLVLSGGSLVAQDAKVQRLMIKDLVDVVGKELTMITVEYAPGAADLAHRHFAQAMVYVLEGSVVMQLEGGAAVTLGPGQTFYEGPDDVHVIGRNASATQPARLLVVLVKHKGAILTPVK